MILNGIERYDFKYYWMIWLWMELIDMILNDIKWYDSEYSKKLWRQILRILISSLSFDNKSLIISMFSILIAQYNAVRLINIIMKFHLKILFWILLKDMILNVIEWYDFEFHWMIWLWMSLKDMIVNYIEKHYFEFRWKLF